MTRLSDRRPRRISLRTEVLKKRGSGRQGSLPWRSRSGWAGQSGKQRVDMQKGASGYTETANEGKSEGVGGTAVGLAWRVLS